MPQKAYALLGSSSVEKPKPINSQSEILPQKAYASFGSYSLDKPTNRQSQVLPKKAYALSGSSVEEYTNTGSQ